MPDVNSWGEWSKHVLKELERLDADIQELQGGINLLRVDIATLKVKAGLFGGLAGAIGAALAVLLSRLH